MSESRNPVSNRLDAESGESVKSEVGEVLCVNCANYRPNRKEKVKQGRAPVAQCMNGFDCIRMTEEVNRITGKPVYCEFSQEQERSHPRWVAKIIGTCGKGGRFFRPLPEDPRKEGE